MYAIIETGGKQVRAGEGAVIMVEKLTAGVGETVAFDRILLVTREDGSVVVGTPVIEGARAVGKVLEQGKGPKIRIFKYKNKTNYRRRAGHRQPFTRVQIEKIEA